MLVIINLTLAVCVIIQTILLKWKEDDYKRMIKHLEEERRKTISELKFGFINNVDISVYSHAKYTAAQMAIIRMGLEINLNVGMYTDPEFDYLQMIEIYKGLKDGLNVSLYAKHELDHHQMNVFRKRLVHLNRMR